MIFNINDLDQDKLDSSVMREAHEIYKNQPRGRSLEKVIYDTRKGHAAEQYLIQAWDYKDNPKKYHDLISPDGHEIECKVIDARYCTDYYIESDPNGYNLKKWMANYTKYNNAKHVMVFSEHEGNYKFFQTYNVKDGTRVEY